MRIVVSHTEKPDDTDPLAGSPDGCSCTWQWRSWQISYLILSYLLAGFPYPVYRSSLRQNGVSKVLRVVSGGFCWHSHVKRSHSPGKIERHSTESAYAVKHRCYH